MNDGNLNPKKSASKGIQSTLIGIFFSILLAIIKGVAGVLGNSNALIADAIESMADVITSIIVLTGLRIASKPADKNHPYGHGKAEPLASIGVALALIPAAVIIVVQSINEIITPHYTPAPFTLIVLVVVVITKESLSRFVFKVGETVESLAVKSDALHHRSDAITSAAAFIGISIALIGGKGYEEADDYAALFASGIILFNAVRLALPAISEIMDTAPPPKILEQVKETAKSVDGVIELDKCYVRKMGFDFYVDIHVMVDGNRTVTEGHEIAHKVKDKLMSSNQKITNVLVHIEPAAVHK
ncbi:MAG TPA: cation diffusion facilitator family transporter [Chitinophagaceae bacterium]|nr:cation diffusion facilitator family transporter [Chitinophagaceae bacterium]